MSSYTQESTLLAPAESEVHSDDWPIFNLSSVEVFDESPQNANPLDLVSLLIADVEKPLKVRGKLNSVPRELGHLRLRPSRGSELVELNTVRQFAYGQYDDGAVDLWAAGKAGWFALRPSKAYKHVFAEMIQAIELLYFLADAYGGAGNGTRSRKGKKREVNPSADEVFAKYATVNSLRGEDHAQQVFEKHTTFLVKSMVQGKEGITWERTAIWAWMNEVRPDLFAQPELPQLGDQKSKKRKRSTAYESRQSVASTGRDTAEAGSANGRKSIRLSAEPATPGPDSSDTASNGTASTRPRRGHKGKSVLRPRISKYVPIETEESESLDEPGKAASKPVIFSSSNIAESKPPPPPTKTRIPMNTTTGADIDEGIDMSLDQSEEDDGDPEDEIIIASIAPGGNPIPVRLRKEHLEATGEGDTWSCPLDGCTHKVYAASESSSQLLIKGHYRTHVNHEDTEMRMALVRRMQAPGLPVSRLVGRIQQLAGQHGFPAQIARRF